MNTHLALPSIVAATLALVACGGGDDGATGAGGGGAAPSAQRPVVGIGEQGFRMFSDARFTRLHVKHVRLVASYDTTRVGFDRDLADQWLAAARKTGSEPFVTFGHSRVHPRRLPSVAEYRAAFRAFRKRYPDVRVYAPWNEINHASQPTARAPERAAEYYNVMKAECAGCVVLAGDVLDQAGMTRYLERYARRLDGTPTTWGLHNYADANRLRSRGLRGMLAAVKGEIWLTETGGLVEFGRSFPRDEQRAARATRYALRQAREHDRVGRIYLYNWTGTEPGARFDAGLVGPDGSPRPAYDVLREALGR